MSIKIKNKDKIKWQDIKIEITVKPDKIEWKTNIDNMDLIFYLQRIIYFINKEMNEQK